MSKQTYFRVCHKDTLQGLWYTYNGEFTGLIHNEFGFCQNNELRMDFDEEIVGWLSAVETLDNLFHWFSKEDISRLQEHGWFIHEFEAIDVKFYERFQHTVIKQDTSKVVMVHELMRNGGTRELGVRGYDENTTNPNLLSVNISNLDELLNKHAKQHMIEWDLERFKISHRRLYATFSAVFNEATTNKI